MTALQAVFDLLAGSPGLGVLTAFGLVGIAVLVSMWILGRLAGRPRAHGSTVLRGGSDQVVFVRLRDPDTAGRPRPRAPSGSPALV
jgi:hypothetical protein